MQISHFLSESGSIPSIARELGISEQQAEQGAAALLPSILGGFKKQVQSQPTGLDGFGGLLGMLGGGGLLDDVVGSHPTNIDRGNDVLGQIFGTKDVSRAVAQNASSKTGLDTGVLKKMLPMLAMAVAGYMARRRTGIESTPEKSRTGGGLGAMLDLDGDGNPLDDIIGRFIR
ncbi:MAG TPA: DUF937 domain-containing protein [Gemmatimonadaceae bacterium]